MNFGDEPTLIGTVRDVNGPSVGVKLNSASAAGLKFVQGRGYRIGQVGSFVKCPVGFLDLFGVVTQVGASALPQPLGDDPENNGLWMTVQLVGEARRGGRFERGLGQYPTFGDPVHLVTEADLRRVYSREFEPGKSIRIGSIASAESIPAEVGVNRLVTRHSAVVGSTGAGKSTTVAKLLEVLSQVDIYPSARILVFDVHGEYARAADSHLRVLRVDAEDPVERLHMPYWALNFDELLTLTFGPVKGAERSALLNEVTARKQQALQSQPRRGVKPDTVTVDAPVPFSIHDLWLKMYRQLNSTHLVSGNQSRTTEALQTGADGKPIQEGDALKVVPPLYRAQTQAAGEEKIYLSNNSLNLRREVDSLGVRLRDRRFSFLFEPGEWSPDLNGTVEADLDKLLQSWLGAKEPVTIVDLSGIPPEVLHDVIGIMLRIVYDALYWGRDIAEGGRERPLLVILEEAHAYLGPNSGSLAGSSVRKIVKEGRKYGVGAMIVSQRPSEVDHTVLSQCGTTFALRLANSQDRAHVVSSVSNNLEGLLSMLPVLRTGEAIVIGEAVNLPMRVLIDQPGKGRRPDSSDPSVFGEEGPSGWNKAREPEDYSELVELWRSQRSQSPRVVKEGA